MPRFLDFELLRRVRVELGLTQEQAAQRLGITARSYRRYESGAVNDRVSGFVVRHANRRRLTDRICSEFGLTEDILLKDEGAAPQAAVGRAWRQRRVHPLPRARHFVGRETQVAELSGWLAAPSPEVRVVAVVAVGGAGKTTLLERLLSGDAAGAGETVARGLFVWSFYEDARIEAFLREACAYFASPSGTVNVERLSEALDAGPGHVLALDGLE